MFKEIYRVFFLLRIRGLSLFFRLKQDLAREFTVFLCSLTLVGLFFYIFHDFLTEKISDLPVWFILRLQAMFALSVEAFVCLLYGNFLANEWTASKSVLNFSLFLGEEKIVARFYWLLFLFFSFLPVLSFNFWISSKFLPTFYSEKAFYLLAYLLLSLLFFTICLFLKKTSFSLKPNPSLVRLPKSGILPTMLLWQAQQLFFYDKVTLLLVLNGIALCAIPVIVTTPFFLFLSSLLITILGEAALSICFAKNLRASWMEKNQGVTQEQFLTSFHLLGILLGTLFGLAQCTCSFIGNLQKGTPSSVLLMAQLFFISSLGPILVPSFALILDGKKPFITFITILLICLFLGTAIYANLFFVALVPMAIQYGNLKQKDLFYSV